MSLLNYRQMTLLTCFKLIFLCQKGRIFYSLEIAEQKAVVNYQRKFVFFRCNATYKTVYEHTSKRISKPCTDLPRNDLRPHSSRGPVSEQISVEKKV